jgi:hypothetical protein
MEMTSNNQVPISVFVHLGSCFPEHLHLNLLRHLAIFPGRRVTLILDQELPFSLPRDIHIYRYQVSKSDEVILGMMERVTDFQFRKGFWKYTFLRLFALGAFHETHPHEAVLHIESDVILMPNFPWQNFISLNSLAWIGVNESCDVASLVYSPSSHETSFLLSEIRKYAQDDPTTTDMYSLRTFATNHPSRHSYLPSLTKITTRNQEKFDIEAAQQLRNFQGYFDPLALGMWYFGQDPKNKYGLRRRYFIDSTYDLDPSRSKPFFENGRLFDDLGLNIYSLHIHAKFLPLFGTKWDQALERELVAVRKKSDELSFSISAFIGAISDRKAIHNFWLLFASVPGINYLRKYHLIEEAKNILKRLLRIKM